MAVSSVSPIGFPHLDLNLTKWCWGSASSGGLTTSNVGVPIGAAVGENQANYADRSVQVTGTFGAGGSVQIEGSNDGGVTYNIMNDAFGNPLVITSGVIKQITECAERIRPNVTAGDGTTSIIVSMFMRKIISQ